MHGNFLKSVLEKEQVETKGMILDDAYFTTLAFVNVGENGERSFFRLQESQGQIQNSERRDGY